MVYAVAMASKSSNRKRRKTSDFEKLSQLVVAEIHDLRDDMSKRFDELTKRGDRIEMKVDGVSNRLDYELDHRKQLEVRVTALERKGVR